MKQWLIHLKGCLDQTKSDSPHLANNANKATLPTNCRESGSFSGANWKGQEGWGVVDERLEPLHRVLNNLLQSPRYPRGNETTKGLLGIAIIRTKYARIDVCKHRHTETHTYFSPQDNFNSEWNTACKRTGTEYRNANIKIVAIF